jgi:hypothetical protein
LLLLSFERTVVVSWNTSVISRSFFRIILAPYNPESVDVTRQITKLSEKYVRSLISTGSELQWYRTIRSVNLQWLDILILITMQWFSMSYRGCQFVMWYMSIYQWKLTVDTQIRSTAGDLHNANEQNVGKKKRAKSRNRMWS